MKLISKCLLLFKKEAVWAFSVLLSFNLTWAQDSLIRVRVADSIPHGKIQADGDNGQTWQFRCQGGHVFWGKNMKLRKSVMISSSNGLLKFSGRHYRSQLWVHPVEDHCEVVNHVEMDRYLEGLVNSEFSSKWSEEAIAAQVVAARTYAYFQMKEARVHRDSRYDLDASVKDQVYEGSSKEDPVSARIVEKTRGLILTSGPEENFVPIKAFYHSTCGGKTELPKNAWGSSYSGFRKTVTCPFCVSSPHLRWNLFLPTSEIATAVQKGIATDGLMTGWPKEVRLVLDRSKLLDLRAHALDSEGRVSQVITVWAIGKKALELPIPASRFRSWIGSSRFRSTRFQVVFSRPDGLQGYYFQGTGNGHGVGMCQWGAKVMGEKQYKMAEILKYYYPDAVLRKVD